MTEPFTACEMRENAENRTTALMIDGATKRKPEGTERSSGVNADGNTDCTARSPDPESIIRNERGEKTAKNGGGSGGGGPAVDATAFRSSFKRTGR
ncbi:Hypothetical protein CINCED_3A018884 [Cinara cedri]|uniref:Uncharacterized protein n=1 Tax=Cinara cedri TaxID=506608 RepID=A0A5E4MT93_9HEMI|nr:Hypothetical protein CINCED_3A018884 [Cinara cedri]